MEKLLAENKKLKQMLDVRASRAPSTPARSVTSTASKSCASTPTPSTTPASSVKAQLDDNDASMDRLKAESIAKLNHRYDVSHEDSCMY